MVYRKNVPRNFIIPKNQLEQVSSDLLYEKKMDKYKNIDDFAKEKAKIIPLTTNAQ